MPWTNQGGGAGGSGGGGPWGGSGQGGPEAPNLEDILRDSQDRLRRFIPGGGGGLRSVLLVLLIAVAAWMASGLYTVNTDEQGVVLRFGKWVRTTQPGLHYHLPGPFETVLKPAVTKVNKIEIGFRSPGPQAKNRTPRQVSEEALMLTGDENIVDINFAVFWFIKDAGNFLFNVRNPELTVKNVAESAMREVIGQDQLQQILTKGRVQIEERTKTLMQQILDDYGAGVEISQVKLEKVDPPEQVIDSFRDVQAAKADQERLQNQALSYRNDIVPKSRGQAAQIVQEAEAYKQQVVARATGDAKRFLSVYESYLQAKDVTKRRMYLEALEESIGDLDKIIVDLPGNTGAGVVPYLPLNELLKGPSSRAAAPAPRAPRPAPSTDTNPGDGG